MRRIPVFVLTGFLGAGKSTLLNRLLVDPAFADTAVIINEFGDIALDHDLVRVGRAELARTTTGCLCCTAGSDIRATLHELHGLASSGQIAFSRVIVETTGLADPAPLVNQLLPGGTPAFGLRDHVVARNFVLAGVTTLVDIVTGEIAIDNHFEAAKQVAFADRLVLTKTDLARDPASRRDVGLLRDRLSAMNAFAAIVDGHAAELDLAGLFVPRPYAPTVLGEDVLGWLALEETIRHEAASHAHAHAGAARDSDPVARHGGRIRSFAITRDRPVTQAGLRKFLDLLAMTAGPRMLRVKGLVHDADHPDRPRVVHLVQHVVHPPAVLDAWPSDDRRTRLVFIADGIDPQPVRELFEAALDDRPAGAGRALRALTSNVTATLTTGAAQLARALRA